MRRIIPILLVTVLAAVVGVRSGDVTHAAPTGLNGAGVAELDFCLESETCIVRGIGDFNGDGVDDIAFETLATHGRVSRQSGRPSSLFEIYLGPFAAGADDAPGPSRAPDMIIDVTELPFARPLTVADVNGDGMDDLAFVSAGNSASRGWQRIAIVLGRTEWGQGIRLGKASRGDILIERDLSRAYHSPRTGNPQLTVEFADVNGDGHLDVILAADSVNAEFAPGLDEPSEIAIMFGRGEWPSRTEFRSDVLVTGMGTCAQSLAATGDVTGDGVADLVVRRCSNDGLPDLPSVVPGRDTWSPALSVTAQPAPGPVPGVVLGHRLPAGLDVEVPPPGRGYIPSLPGREMGAFDPGPMVFLEDLNDDGTLDIGFEFGDKTHIWLGGRDVVETVAASTSDRIFLNASFGATGFARSWRRADLDADGTRDLVLGHSEPLDDALVDRLRRGGRGIPPGMTLPSGDSFIQLYRGDRVDAEVLDLATDMPDLVWRDEDLLWGVGDFNGDGFDDLLLGSSPHLPRSRYAIVAGPLVMYVEAVKVDNRP